MSMSEQEIILVYDQECPACDNYSQFVRVRDTVGKLILVDARQDSEIMDEITAFGLDIDQGMVLKIGEQFYYGADAIQALAMISSRSGIFNKLNYWTFRYKWSAHLLYPMLRFFRNLLLKFLKKTKINNLNQSDNNQF